jgi:RNA-directed DNA polymerase
MRELYIEGVAIRGGPESCAGVREGVGEALTGVRAGWAIEPRKHSTQGADAVEKRGRRDRWLRYREWLPGPAWSKNLCMHGISMRENREVPRSPSPAGCGAGRGGNASAVRPR